MDLCVYVCVGVSVCVLCLGQLKFLQSVFAQVISGQVFPGHQSNHLQKVTNQRCDIRTIVVIVIIKNTRKLKKRHTGTDTETQTHTLTLFSSSTTTRCRSPSALNSLNTRGRDVSCRQIASFNFYFIHLYKTLTSKKRFQKTFTQKTDRH